MLFQRDVIHTDVHFRRAFIPENHLTGKIINTSVVRVLGNSIFQCALLVLVVYWSNTMQQKFSPPAKSIRDVVAVQLPVKGSPVFDEALVENSSREGHISIPIRGALEGIAREANTPVMIGNKITAVCDTGIVCGMSIARSFSFVSNRIIGG